MKYISEVIGYPDGVVPGLFYRTPSAGAYIRLGVYDTDTGETDSYCGDSVEALVKAGCFGCTGKDIFSGGAVVSNSAKTIQIHQYIKSAVTRIGSSRNWALSDICILNKGGRPTHRRVDGRGRLTVEMGSDSVTMRGVGSSIGIRQNGIGTRIDVYNMYDLLGSLCRDCELNLLTYDTIRLYTRSGEDSSMTTIELLHDAEANRFFTKMWLDVNRK